MAARKRKKSKKSKRSGRVDLREVLVAVLERHVPAELQRLAKARNLWIELFPVNFADHVWPMLVQGHRLIVHVHDSQWLHEMTYWRQEVLDRLAEVWPESEIEAIEAFVGQLPPLAERRPEAPPPPPPPDLSPVLEPEVPPETMTALSGIRDGRLRDVLAAARMRLGRERGPGT